MIHLLKLFCPEVLFFICDFSAKKWQVGQNLKHTVMVAFKLEAPMLYMFSVAHIECNRRPHAEHASAREYLPKWLLVLKRRQWRRRRRRETRGRRRSFRSGVHTSVWPCLYLLYSRFLPARSTRTTLYSEFSLADGLGKLRTAFSSGENEGWGCSLFLSILPAFRFSFSLVSCQRCRHVTFTDVPDSLFIFRSRECKLHRNWTYKFYKIFF